MRKQWTSSNYFHWKKIIQVSWLLNKCTDLLIKVTQTWSTNSDQWHMHYLMFLSLLLMCSWNSTDDCGKCRRFLEELLFYSLMLEQKLILLKNRTWRKTSSEKETVQIISWTSRICQRLLKSIGSVFSLFNLRYNNVYFNIFPSNYSCK
jgi:hypothetical protein